MVNQSSLNKFNCNTGLLMNGRITLRKGRIFQMLVNL